ncbi:MAG: DUF29 family protein [Nostoc sp.]|uniref:DUF29 family protein n=1 Tax=Nostoc sp. TaxID=1180 RepID=UPI002FF7ABF5
MAKLRFCGLVFVLICNFKPTCCNAIASSDNAITSPDNAIVSPNNAITSPDNAIVSPDNAIVLPDNAIASLYENYVESSNTFTELPINTFPVECPYSIAQVLDNEFLPDIIDL